MLNWLSKEFLIAVCGALAIALISLWPSPPYQTSQGPQIESKQHADSANEGQEQRKEPEASIASRRDDNAGHGSEEASEYWTFLRRKLKITDTLLVLFTFTLWWSTRGLVNEAKQASERQLRAYIAGRPNFLSSFNTQNFCWATFEIVNVGTTPANEVQHAARIDVLPYPIPPGFIFPQLSDRSHKITSFSNLPSLGKITALRSFSEPEIDAIRAGSSRVYMFGEITYRHLFGSGVTKFGASVTADAATLEKLTDNYLGKDLNLEFVALDEWNYAE